MTSTQCRLAEAELGHYFTLANGTQTEFSKHCRAAWNKRAFAGLMDKALERYAKTTKRLRATDDRISILYTAFAKT